MYDILKDIAEANNWVFNYGRRDFDNLFNEEEQTDTAYIFLDPVKITDVDNEAGVTEGKRYSGSFLFVRSSSLDEESYEYRYENYIKKILDENVLTIKNTLICNDDVIVESWAITEVINIFDYNFDGIIVDYQVLETL